MNAKNLLLTGLGAITILTFTMTSFANPTINSGNKPINARGAKRGIARCMRYNQITPEKQSAFKQICDQYRQKNKPLRELLIAKRAMLKAELLQPNLNTTKIKTLVDRINSLRGELLANRVDMVVQVKQKVGISLPLCKMMHKKRMKMRRGMLRKHRRIMQHSQRSH